MAGRYQNVFVYYREPSAAGRKTERAQLENNTTKALANLLEHCDPALTSSFLYEVLCEKVKARRYDYSLQTGPEGPKARRRFLVGISREGSEPSGTSTSGAGAGGRVDAVIYAPGELLVAVEVKTGGARLDPSQLERHRKRWSVPSSNTRIARWPDIHAWARGEGERRKRQPDRFLLEQFVDYLEREGLGFGGFRKEDFEALRGRDEAARAAAKSRVEGMWEAVQAELDRPDQLRLGTIKPIALRRGEHRSACQTNWKEGRVNLTLELATEEAEQLELEAVAWPKPQAQAFVAWLRNTASHDFLRRLPAYRIVLYARIAGKTRSGGRTWRHETYEQRHSIQAPEFTEAWLNRRLWRFGHQEWELPAFHLRRTWPATDVLARGAALAPAVAREVRRLFPVLDSVNSTLGKPKGERAR